MIQFEISLIYLDFNFVVNNIVICNNKMLKNITITFRFYIKIKHDLILELI